MAIILWPALLPQSPLIEGFSEAIAESRTKSPVTTGLGKRAAFWIGVSPIACSMNLTQGQWQILKRFWEETTALGILPFWISDPLLDGSILTTTAGVIITTTGGDPIRIAAKMLIQFGDSPPHVSQAYRSDLYKVELDLQVLP